MSPAGDLEYFHFFSPSMWPSDAPKPELTTARESLDNETVSNSASNHVEDELDISSESAEFSDWTKCELEDPKNNSPKLLLGAKKFNENV